MGGWIWIDNFTEPKLSTGGLLSDSWWHPVPRRAALWLWLFVASSAAVGLLVWLIAWIQRAEGVNRPDMLGYVSRHRSDAITLE